MVALIKLLLSYFKEDQLVEYFQVRKCEINLLLTYLFVKKTGDLYRPLFFHVVFGGKIRATLNSIDDAVMLLFGLYYVFNLEYHSHAAQTLEFIQRKHKCVNAAFKQSFRQNIFHDFADVIDNTEDHIIQSSDEDEDLELSLLDSQKLFTQSLALFYMKLEAV
ncbi:hypothetical protein LOTGIDRAFT_154716 [Lottia gigantea]|uniref:Uncharacterized protein n=1 Tax=Lottia gigantea TaxID=225164 RepID=V3Z8I0_LOTGI|nr:hypothetical protein LOTGIDRAFT_154716 [Lottia gigantea]ESO87213.1 hypothetical protein LOTGIDRAFT_154716 [Lottia gigantea]